MANDVTITVGGVDRSGSAFDSATASEKKLERATQALNDVGQKACLGENADPDPDECRQR